MANIIEYLNKGDRDRKSTKYQPGQGIPDRVYREPCFDDAIAIIIPYFSVPNCEAIA